MTAINWEISLQWLKSTGCSNSYLIPPQDGSFGYVLRGITVSTDRIWHPWFRKEYLNRTCDFWQRIGVLGIRTRFHSWENTAEPTLHTGKGLGNSDGNVLSTFSLSYTGIISLGAAVFAPQLDIDREKSLFHLFRLNVLPPIDNATVVVLDCSARDNTMTH